MKSKLLLFALLLRSVTALYAQKENNVWVFGNKNGLDFNAGAPTLITSSITSNEGCASVSSRTTGKLLFYSNGQNVWDNTHTLMPNGSGILGAPSMSSTMGVAITPLSTDTNLYFLFTLDSYEQKTRRLKYSLIDMRLNGGKGDVVASVKNIVLPDTFMSEKMIVAPACGGVWLITHHTDSALFYAYRITGTVVPAPVKSYTAGINAGHAYYVGEMKMSANAQRIAVGNYYVPPPSGTRPMGKLEVYDFDKTTGMVSTSYVIDSADRFYSVEFSPDASKLYAVNYGAAMYQYDLSLLPSTSAVYGSKYTLSGTAYVSALRGPDNKVYTVRSGGSRISRVNDPNKPGAACDVELDVASLTLAGSFLIFGNNTAIPYWESTGIVTQRKDTFICDGESLTYNGTDGRDMYQWNDGDTSRKRTFTTQGTYWLLSTSGCAIFVDTLYIVGGPKDTLQNIVLDTTLCFAASLEVKVPAVFNKYLWSDGSSAQNNIFDESGTKWVISTNNGCTFYVDTFHVRLTNFELGIPDTVICDREKILLNANVGQSATYQWQDGSTTDTFLVTQPGKYWVEAAIGDCKKKDNIDISHKPFELELGADTVICEGVSLNLHPGKNDVSYLWSNGSTEPALSITQTGMYTLHISQKGCHTEDSIQVTFRKCGNCVNIPNAFTPNRDGKNDVFRTILSCPTIHYSLLIVNRYGEPMFKTENPLETWDGTFNGQDQEVGVFYYLVKVLFDYPNAKEEIYKGDVSLIR